MRIRDYTFSKVSKCKKYKHPKFMANRIQDNKSIFDNVSTKPMTQVNNSVDQTRRNRINSNISIEYNSMPKHFQISMQDQLGKAVRKRLTQVKNSPHKEYNLPRDRRQDIAMRIISKLQYWPQEEQRVGKTFKKFYWTKDYSHCAFANDNEVSDGFLIKH